MKIIRSQKGELIVVCDICFKETYKKFYNLNKMNKMNIDSFIKDKMEYRIIGIMIGGELGFLEVCKECEHHTEDNRKTNHTTPEKAEKIMNDPIHKLKFMSKKYELVEKYNLKTIKNIL